MKPAPLDVAGSVELAVVERSGFPESRHLGVAVRVGPSGDVEEALGDPSALIYPRSAAKPLQAAAMLRLGAPLEGAHLAIATASHAGTPDQVRLVEQILAGAGLTADELRCPAVWPRRPAVIAGRQGPERITMTCSGKHAGFLAAAVSSGADPAGYLDRDHPVQREVATVIEELAGETVAHWGVDGCLAPTPVLSVAAFARAVSRVLREEPRILDAARSAPWALDEPGGENAVVIEETGGFAKTGAEGVVVVALPSGDAVVVKALDGAERIGTPVAVRMLERAGLLDGAVAGRVRERVGSASMRVAF